MSELSCVTHDLVRNRSLTFSPFYFLQIARHLLNALCLSILGPNETLLVVRSGGRMIKPCGLMLIQQNPVLLLSGGRPTNVPP